MADGNQAPRGNAHDERKNPIPGLTNADGRLESVEGSRFTASSAPEKVLERLLTNQFPPHIVCDTQ